MLGFLEHIVFAFVVIVVVNAWSKHGMFGVMTVVVGALNFFPGFQSLVRRVLSGEVKSFTSQIKPDSGTTAETTGPPKVVLPKQGVPHEQLLMEMQRLKDVEKGPQESKLFAYVYTGNDEHFGLQKKAYDMFTDKTGLSVEHDELIRRFREAFMHENALSPMVFPALRRFETEVVSMTAGMLNGDCHVVGTMTSCGTESLLLAVKTYRDRARDLHPHIRQPEMVAPITIHPGHEKAAHYFGVTIVHVPVNAEGLPNVEEYENAITDRTIALLTSAPQYCHGAVDPIQQISAIAVRRGLPLHVDACFGGFMLPWVEKLGHPVPVFDFRLPGVTSMSADVHKYGFGCKGASVVLYRDQSIRKYQFFAYSKWPGGLFGSPSMAGTRPGGNIAAAWVALMAMGEDGYMRVAKQLMTTTKSLIAGINDIPGLYIIGQPVMTAFAVASDDPDLDIYALADDMETRGWKLERQQHPSSLHFSIMPHHSSAVDKLLADLRLSADVVKSNKTLAKKGTAAMYGTMANIPDNAILDEFLVQFFSEMYQL